MGTILYAESIYAEHLIHKINRSCFLVSLNDVMIEGEQGEEILEHKGDRKDQA